MTEQEKQLYIKTKERLRRLGKENPADVIVALAEEGEYYRDRIRELEDALLREQMKEGTQFLRLTPTIEEADSFGDRLLCCPHCLGPETNYWAPGTKPKHCQFCGQALDWSEEVEEHKPPNVGSSVQKPTNPETVWRRNLDNLPAGTLGDPKDPETMLRYWKAQEIAGYPYASENVKYFTELVARLKEAPPRGREGRWRGARGCFFCSLCDCGEVSEHRRYCPDCGARMTNYKED